MICWISLQTMSNYLLSIWSNAGEEADEIYYATLYAIFALSFSFFSLIRAATLYWRSLKCSKKIHENMLRALIRAPVNTFFDRVPIGRILNRFSKDLTVLDNYIASSFGSFMVYTYSLLADVLICILIGSVWILPTVVIFFVLSFWIQKLFMKINREVIRLESISKSPILSFFSESLNGLTTIRGYRDQKRFFEVSFL